MQRLGVLSIIIVGISLTIIPALAAAPFEHFTFQGLLKNTDGTLVNGQRDITLRIYTVKEGGTASSSPGSSCPKATAPTCLWQENQTNIQVTSGIFTINAGNTTSFRDFLNFTDQYFLEVIVRTSGGNDQVLSPRINLTSAPFALSAARASGDFDFNQKQLLNITKGIEVLNRTSVNNVANDVLILNATLSAGAPATGFGPAIQFGANYTTSPEMNELASIAAIFTDVTDNSEDAKLQFNVTSAGSPATRMELSPSGLSIGGGPAIRSILFGSAAATFTNALQAITVTGAAAGDVAFCSVQALTGTGIVVDVGDVTTNTVNVNATRMTATDSGTINCIVFDLTP